VFIKFLGFVEDVFIVGLAAVTGWEWFLAWWRLSLLQGSMFSSSEGGLMDTWVLCGQGWSSQRICWFPLELVTSIDFFLRNQ
jgi:hypothetical protein